MYAIKEAIKGLAHTRSMAVVSIITITVALVILGILGIITLYGHGFVNSLIKSEEINVFLKDEMSDADMLALDATLISMSEIESTRIMTKEDAAKELENLQKLGYDYDSTWNCGGFRCLMWVLGTGLPFHPVSG